MSGRSDDWFRFDLTLRHQSDDPAVYTKELGITPRHSVRAGSLLGSITRKATVWTATLYEGTGKDDDAFSEGLQEVVAKLENGEEFLWAFLTRGGQSWLTINHAIGFDTGILSRITLEPAFLSCLVKCGLALTMQGWSAGKWPDVEAADGALRKADFSG